MSKQYFGTDGVRGRVGQERMNPDFVMRLAYAAGRVLLEEIKKAGGDWRPGVLIGKDTRISGYMIESALEAGLSAAGVDVHLAGPLPTPGVAYLTRALRLDAGVVVSASHNPYYDNGIKFFTQSGVKISDEIEERIEALMQEGMGCVDSEHLGRAYRIKDAQGRYIEFCKSTFSSQLSLHGLKIVVDAANGAAYQVAPHVFRELGADVVQVGCLPDGFNINEGVGATSPQALAEVVKAEGADYGVALDGDGDRIVMVDSQGRIYEGDELLYVVVQHRTRREKVQGVVGTLMTNQGFEARMKAMDIPFFRAGVGDRFVQAKLKEKGWLYGGETSGHLLFLDCHSTGDGIIAALQVLEALCETGQSLQEATQSLVLFKQHLVNIPLPKGVDWKTHEGFQSLVQQLQAQLADHGRILIRPSGTEPLLRVLVEAEDPAHVLQGVALVKDFQF